MGTLDGVLRAHSEAFEVSADIEETQGRRESSGAFFQNGERSAHLRNYETRFQERQVWARKLRWEEERKTWKISEVEEIVKNETSWACKVEER